MRLTDLNYELQELYISEKESGEKITIFVDKEGKLSGQISSHGKTRAANIKGLPTFIAVQEIELFKKLLNEQFYCEILLDDIIMNGRIRGGGLPLPPLDDIGTAIIISTAVAKGAQALWKWFQGNPETPTNSTSTSQSSEETSILREMKTQIFNFYQKALEELKEKLSNQEKTTEIKIDNLTRDYEERLGEVGDDLAEFKGICRTQEIKIRNLKARDVFTHIKDDVCDSFNEHPYLTITGGIFTASALAMLCYFPILLWEHNRLKKELNEYKAYHKKQEAIKELVDIHLSKVYQNDRWLQYKIKWAEKNGVKPNQIDNYWKGICNENPYELTISNPNDIKTPVKNWQEINRQQRTDKNYYAAQLDSKDSTKGAVFIKSFQDPLTRPERQESHFLKTLNSPWTVPFYGEFLIDIGSIKYHCLVMELTICSMGKMLQIIPNIPPPIIFKMALEMLEGLCFLHLRGIWHRDLKPDNILVDQNFHCVLTDFGDSKDSNQPSNTDSINNSRRCIGTPRYSAPEAFARLDGNPNFSEKADVYSAGLVLWCMLQGTLLTDQLRPTEGTFPDNEGEILVRKLNIPADRYTGDVLALFHNVIRQCCCTPATKRPFAYQLRDSMIPLNKQFPLKSDDLNDVIKHLPNLIEAPEKYYNSLGFN